MVGRSDLLQAAVRKAEKLPRDGQDAVAHVIDETIAADEAWERALQDPRSEKLLKRLADEARSDIAKGKVFDLDPSDHQD